MACGDAFLMPAPGGPVTPHLWIFVTERNPETHFAVIVSVTTLSEGKDQTIILRRGDHVFITHDSSISYRHARIVDCRQIDAQVQAKTIEPRAACTPKLLKEIQDGLFASQFTPKKIFNFCKTVLGR
jgi:hypothetical protein